MNVATMDGLPLVFAKDPERTRKVLYYLQQLRRRDGQTVFGERMTGKSTALLIFAHELMEAGRKVVFYLKEDAVRFQDERMWRDMYPDEPLPMFTNKLTSLQDADAILMDEPILLDAEAKRRIYNRPETVLIASVGSF